MKISKTRFIKFLKVLKYLNFKFLYQNKSQFLLDFSNELKDLINEETYAKKLAFLQENLSEQDEYQAVLNQKHLNIMQPYYKQLELLVGSYLEKHFPGEVIFSLETYQQKKFQMNKQGYQFYCFLDGYQEDKTTIRIFETKTTTSKKFLKLQFVNDNKEKMPFFHYTSPNTLSPFCKGSNQDNPSYQKKMQTFFNPKSQEGKYIYDLTYQRWVIENNLTEAQKNKKIEYYLVVLNSDYVYDCKSCNAALDPNLLTFIDLTLITQQGTQILENDANLLISYLSSKTNKPNDTSAYYLLPEKILHFYENIPSKDSIFTYFYNHLGFFDSQNKQKHETQQLILQQYYHVSDIPFAWLNRFDNKVQQKVTQKKLPYYCFDKIKAGLQILKYPLYYLDFEAFPCPFPRFKGEKPYTQSLFQFSLHIEKAPGLCNKDKNHVSFLAPDHADYRKTLLEKLTNAILDDGGSIIVYHKAFEKTRLQELSLLFPEYSLQIQNIIARIFDLKDLLKGSKTFYQNLGFDSEQAAGINFYHPHLQGSFSIKKITPLFCNLNYQNLVIQNGIEAFLTYIQLPKMSPLQFQAQFQALEQYCKQDTWVMVEILKGLISQTQKPNFLYLTPKDIVQ
ncbi:DUF2779 domain-containing protein ['Santalum album' aster yellows phytoplasma]|uniref:DUF2779 domain-containing protein n=1 Tax='Santalum album' aster yellows phytoplasma TaxID=2831467 RepID=A0ABS5LL07_9MOLU|nr:DUF2779 domain-containing protein ['Santalum album' aster yellows phytoplasma]MBS2994055.1 DUF2779 domain-containing protein ['Santalum album' aster yellows phytoplasma]